MGREPLPRRQLSMKRSALDVESADSTSSPGISPPFDRLFRTKGQVAHVLLTRSPLYRGSCDPFLVRLACVRHAASVRSEPGSNSPLKSQALAGLRLLGKRLTCKRSLLRTQIDVRTIQFSKSSCREAAILQTPSRRCQEQRSSESLLDCRPILTISFRRATSTVGGRMPTFLILGHRRPAIDRPGARRVGCRTNYLPVSRRPSPRSSVSPAWSWSTWNFDAKEQAWCFGCTSTRKGASRWTIAPGSAG